MFGGTLKANMSHSVICDCIYSLGNPLLTGRVSDLLLEFSDQMLPPVYLPHGV